VIRDRGRDERDRGVEKRGERVIDNRESDHDQQTRAFWDPVLRIIARNDNKKFHS